MREGVTEEVGKEMRIINRNVASSSTLLLLDFFIFKKISEVRIYKRKQESKKTRKKRKKELDQESDQEKKNSTKKAIKKTRTRPRKRP